MNLNKITLIPSVLVVAALSTLVAFSPVNAATKGERMSFEQVDADGSGGVTSAELAARGAAQAAARFAKADTNGDGFLSAEELTEMAKARDQDRAEKRLARMLKHRDANEDGKLSAEEMTPSEEQTTKRFGRADKNDDGVLSAEEFEQASKRGNRGKRSKRGE